MNRSLGVAWCATAVAACSLGKSLSGYATGEPAPTVEDASADRASGADAAPPSDDADAAPTPDATDSEVEVNVQDAEPNDGPLVCVGNLTPCGTECVDLQSHPGHCGGCGYACPGQCASGLCRINTTHFDYCHGVVIPPDEDVAYVAAHGSEGGIYRISLTTGETVELEPTSCGCWILIADATLYWTAECDPNPGVYRRSLDSGPAVRVDSGNPERPYGLAVFDGHVYFTDYGVGDISRAPLAGGTPEHLWGPPEVTQPMLIAIRDGWIYVTDWGDKRVKRMPVDDPGASPESIYYPLTEPYGVDVGEFVAEDKVVRTHVVVTFLGGAGVAYRKDDETWKWTGLGATPGFKGAQVILDQTTAYWSVRVYPEAEGGALHRYRFGGLGTAEKLVDSRHPVGIARHGPFLYWCSFADGLLRMVVDGP